MDFESLLRKNIFPIPVGERWGYSTDNLYLLYSPFTRQTTLVDKGMAHRLECVASGHTIPDDEATSVFNTLYADAASQLSKSRIRHPDDYVRMSIIPTHSCNFTCSYCYSRKGRRNESISVEHLRLAINYFLRERQFNKKFFLFISGGGEPLMAWDQLKFAIEYSRAKALEHGYSLEIMEICNGSLLTEEVIDFLKKHHVNLCISFEILEELQNIHRGHYSLVREKIGLLLQKKLYPSFNATITPESVHHLSEMIEEVSRQYPGVRNVMFEPFTAVDGFVSLEKMQDFYDSFLTEFTKAKQLADALDIQLNTSILDDFNRVAERHCQGKLCLTPAGCFTICHSATSPLEKQFAKCVYGEVSTTKGLVFDQRKFEGLMNVNVYSRKECETCFAKWHCGGGCMNKLASYRPEEMAIYCSYYRKHILSLLLHDLELQITQLTGSSLAQFLQTNFPHSGV